MDGWPTSTKSTVQKIPLLTTRAGRRDGEKWLQRRKEEFMALIKYMEMNKEKDNDWFRISPNEDGTKWKGKCCYVRLRSSKLFLVVGMTAVPVSFLLYIFKDTSSLAPL